MTVQSVCICNIFQQVYMTSFSDCLGLHICYIPHAPHCTTSIRAWSVCALRHLSLGWCSRLCLVLPEATSYHVAQTSAFQSVVLVQAPQVDQSANTQPAFAFRLPSVSCPRWMGRRNTTKVVASHICWSDPPSSSLCDLEPVCIHDDHHQVHVRYTVI